VHDFDVLVVGGGMAGLSAALWLARYRRRVRVLDSGHPRNHPTWAVHGYPGIPDPPPHELRKILIGQARAAGAEWEGCNVVSVDGAKPTFTATLGNGEVYAARRIILAYGRQDILPDIEGLEALYGKSVFHCPDCDGPSAVGARIAMVGWDRAAAIHALLLLTWARQVCLLTNGREAEITDEARAVLTRNDVAINTQAIARLCSSDDRLSAVEFQGGDAMPFDYLFFHIGSHQSSDIADQLGCKRDDDDNLEVDNAQETSVKGVFAAGDLTGPPYLAISAAAKGVKAALAVHKSLLPPDLEI
jgi:thioredoxin reductase